MERLTKTVANNKFGSPGEPPKTTIEAVTVNDLIAQLIKIRDEHGDVPVVQTGRSQWDGTSESRVAIRDHQDHSSFEVYDDRPKYTHDTAYEAVEGWNYDGPFLNVRVDV